MKRLVICCDGTWNSADSAAAETNVFHFAKAVHATKGQSGVMQVVLYLRGVGTTGLKVGDIIAGAIGFGIDENIRSAYMFLAQNYLPGDEIFMVGFSRGAFTVRSLAGLVHAVGLLKRERLDDMRKAWEYYRTVGDHSPDAFCKATGSDCHRDVPIKFLGVWDTVGALGIPGSLMTDINEKSFGFHSTGPCLNIRHGCHALAIDEHRDQFVPTLWTGDALPGMNIEQTWFAGAHADVGGGYATRTLADIPLRWMAKKAEGDELDIDWSVLPSAEELDRLAPTHDSRTGVFSVDKLRPTWREMCGKPCNVSFYERLYAPMDKAGNKLPTIGEAVHRSAIDRFNRTAKACTDDGTGATSDAIYAPINLEALSDAQRSFPTKMAIDEMI